MGFCPAMVNLRVMLIMYWNIEERNIERYNQKIRK
jgi:hypothetical protein